MSFACLPSCAGSLEMPFRKPETFEILPAAPRLVVVTDVVRELLPCGFPDLDNRSCGSMRQQRVTDVGYRAAMSHIGVRQTLLDIWRTYRFDLEYARRPRYRWSESKKQ